MRFGATAAQLSITPLSLTAACDRLEQLCGNWAVSHSRPELLLSSSVFHLVDGVA